MSHQLALKVCLNNEIRKISKAPADFETLVERITQLFGAGLPRKWALQYLDSDGDTIMVSDELDFQEFLEDGVDPLKKIAKKIHIISLQDNNLELSFVLKKEDELKVSEITQEKEVPKENLLDSSSEIQVISVPESNPLYMEEDREELEDEIRSSSGSKLNHTSERRAKQIVKKLAQPNRPGANKKLEKQLRNAEKFLTPEQKQSIEREKEQYLGARFKKDVKTEKENEPEAEMFPTLQESYSNVNKIVHEDVRCDGCSQFPIVGIRYKCSKCEDFDYCERCESKLRHSHPFIQMKKPEEKYSDDEKSGQHRNSPNQGSRKWKPLPSVTASFMKAFEEENLYEEEENRKAALSFDENQHERVNDTLKRIYASEVQEKVQKLSELFPGRRTQDLQGFVSKSHHLSLEALIEKLLVV